MKKNDFPPCRAFLKYSKDKWRLMWVLDHAKTEYQMRQACANLTPFCETRCAGWLEERTANIKKLAGIYPADENAESLRTMLDKVRNMSSAEYDKLYNSIPEEDE